MKNIVQKYLFYLKQQNLRLKKNALQHTLTKPYSPIKSLNKYSLNLKKIKNETAFMGHRTKRFFQWSGKMGERL